jgi:hypothetical protein
MVTPLGSGSSEKGEGEKDGQKANREPEHGNGILVYLASGAECGILVWEENYDRGKEKQ